MHFTNLAIKAHEKEETKGHLPAGNHGKVSSGLDIEKLVKNNEDVYFLPNLELVNHCNGSYHASDVNWILKRL